MPECSVVFQQHLTPHNYDAQVLQFRVFRDGEYLQFVTAWLSGKDLIGVPADLDEQDVLAALAAEAADQIQDAVAAGTLPTASPDVATELHVDFGSVLDRARKGGLAPLQPGAQIAAFDTPVPPNSLPAAAARILEVFAARDLGAGAMIHPADFGDAIIWEGGFVRDEDVREALALLFDGDLLVEHAAAFELTEAGEKIARSSG